MSNPVKQIRADAIRWAIDQLGETNPIDNEWDQEERNHLHELKKMQRELEGDYHRAFSRPTS